MILPSPTTRSARRAARRSDEPDRGAAAVDLRHPVVDARERAAQRRARRSQPQCTFPAAPSRLSEELPERQRLVLSLYYFEDLNLKEIGQVLRVTESRVSQLHAQAVIRLKAKLSIAIQAGELEAI